MTKVAEFFYNIKEGVTSRFPLCCVIQFSFERLLGSPRYGVGLARDGSGYNRGYAVNIWFDCGEWNYVPCSYHVHRYYSQQRRQKSGKRSVNVEEQILRYLTETLVLTRRVNN